MTKEQKTTQEKANAPSEGMNWVEMMSQMCGEGEGCCAGIWGRRKGQQGWGDYMDVMSRFMSSFTGTKAATEEKTANHDAEKA